ncbi:MAG: hypothetical protein H0X29_08490 [Parachlamydiaceae bacterium]|nr:hypothetical protein [Parachlamydiaceae bacterium]
MNHIKYFTLIFLACFSFLKGEQASTSDFTPKMVKIGETEFLFYMTSEKVQVSRDLVKSLNDKKLLLIVEMCGEPYLTTEISAVASICPGNIYGMDIDPLGNLILDQYAQKVIQIVKNDLSIEIEAVSREINLIVSQDAHKFHQDQFKQQYDYLNVHHDTLPECKIIHDLTLIDWNMSKGTISGTLFQDTGGDRLLVALFPGSVVGIITAESPIYPKDNQPPVFPGPKTLPYHAVLSPVDFHGAQTSGSSKGQRISTVVRGIVRGDAFNKIRDEAIPLTPYRAVQEVDALGLKTFKYQNGLVLKELNGVRKVDLSWNCKMPDQENLEILKTDPKANSEIIAALLNMFDITGVTVEDVHVRHLIKKDGGFSKIELLDLDLPNDYQVVLLNSSTLPLDYKYYNISEDLTGDGYPWFHLYEFQPQMAMLLDKDLFQRLSLTPLEELIYRHEVIDNQQIDGIKMIPKAVTRIDVFAFPKK